MAKTKDLVILDFSTAEVIQVKIPANWDTDRIEEYMFDTPGLDLSPGDVQWMMGKLKFKKKKVK